MDSVAVLASGGLDSAVLLADLAQRSTVFPIYVRQGLAWESQEQRALRTFLGALGRGHVKPLVTLSAPVREMYGEHWSVTGKGVPGADEPDMKVFLPGRNILLISLAAVWCSVHGVSRIAIGSLGGNPFPDATPEFFGDLARVLSTGLRHTIAVEAPYRGLHKEEIIARFRELPLERTLTCMAPTRRGVHCGACNKCYERQQAFVKAGVPDRTAYATRKE